MPPLSPAHLDTRGRNKAQPGTNYGPNRAVNSTIRPPVVSQSQLPPSGSRRIADSEQFELVGAATSRKRQDYLRQVALSWVKHRRMYAYIIFRIRSMCFVLFVAACYGCGFVKPIHCQVSGRQDDAPTRVEGTGSITGHVYCGDINLPTRLASVTIQSVASVGIGPRITAST